MNIQNRQSFVSVGAIVLFLAKTYALAKPRVKRLAQGVIDFNYLISEGQKRYVFKIINTRNGSQVDFELSLLRRLARFGFRCPRLVLTKSKKRSAVIAGRPCALLEFISGRILPRHGAKDMAVIGQMLGEFHARLRSFKQKAKKQTWEPSDIKRHVKTYRRSIIQKRYPNARALISFIQKELSDITFPRQLPEGVTHQDVKSENIVKDAAGAIHFIDFDACCRGILLYDFMTPIVWMCFTGSGKLRKQHIQAYARGYQRARKFNEKEKKHFYDALRFRLLREAFVWPMRFGAAAALAKSPRFLRAYKQIGTDKAYLDSLCRI